MDDKRYRILMGKSETAWSLNFRLMTKLRSEKQNNIIAFVLVM
jgi:hypothetical protein